MALLTEDLGVEIDDGFEILGRMEGAEDRGCNLTLEDLEALRERPVRA
jgi:hypothetical protein